MNLRHLNTLETAAAAEALRDSCAATAWVAGMVSGRPYKDTTALLAEAEKVWWDLSAEDWHEALSAEDEGDRRSTSLPEDLAAEYTATFGYAFVTLATTATEVEEECRRRLDNDPVTELRIAATEMVRIVNRRLRRLLDLA